MHRSVALLLATALLFVTFAPLAVPTADANGPAPAPMRFGMDSESIRAQAEAGAKPDLGMFWVGVWTTNWDYIDRYLRDMKSQGVTPVIQWWYWGDDISPSCIENGCSGKSKATWFAMTHTLAERVRTQMGGAEVLISVENEFNKGGVDQMPYATTFDGYLKQHMDILHGVPGVKTIVGFGGWGTAHYKNFPQAIAACDLLGFQLMHGSTRDSEWGYNTTANGIAKTTNFLHSNYGKPVILYDLALSTYPEPRWAELQASVMRQVMSRISEYQSLGLTAIVYRELVDNPNMGLYNYFGMAERYWGLKRTDGSVKPALPIWVEGVRAARAMAPLPPPPEPAKVEAAATLSATTVQQGDSLTGTLTVKNSGGTAITLRSLAFAARPPGGTNAGGPYLDFGSAKDVALAPGETKTFTYTRAFKTSDPVGDWWTYAAVQFPDGRWEDQGPVTTFRVTPPAPPAKVDALVTVTPGTLVRGDTAQASFSLRLANTGGQPATLARVTLTVSPAGEALETLASLSDVTLAPGEVRYLNATRQFPSTATAGDWIAQGSVRHANGTTHDTPRAILVVETPPVVVDASVTTDRATLTHGESLAFEARLRNGGAEGWTLPHVALFAAPRGSDLVEIGSWTDVAAARGATALVSTVRAFTASDPTGEWVTELRLRFPDGSERTVAGPTFQVQPAPGRLGSAVNLSGSSVTIGGGLAGTVTVSNTGGSPLSLAQVVLAARPPGGTNAGGPFLDFGSVGALTLAPGESRSFSFTRTFKSSDPVGDWYAYPAVQLASGAWTDGERVPFRVGAAPPPPFAWAQEAEAMPVKTTGGRYSDASASGGAGWNVWSNGYVESSVSVPTSGAYVLNVTAKGTAAGNVWPTMVVQVDGRTVATFQVSGGKYVTYTYSGTLAAGAHKVRVLFTNDAILNGQDRNLLVDRVAMRAA